MTETFAFWAFISVCGVAYILLIRILTYQNVHEASKSLGRLIVGYVPGVHGISVRRSDPNNPKLNIFVHAENEDAFKKIPLRWKGHRIYHLTGKRAEFKKENSVEI